MLSCIVTRNKLSYCFNCFHSSRTENNDKSNDKLYKNKDYCGIATPSKKDDILKLNHQIKLDKIPYINYADLESLIKNIDGCQNNMEKC